MPALDHFHPRHLCESLDQGGAGGQRFEQRERLGREFRPAWIACVPKYEAQRVHGMGGGGPVIPLFEGVDRVFQRLLCIGGAPGVRRGFGKPGERAGAVWVRGWSERECPLEICEGSIRVEPERTFSGQGEKAPRRVLEGGYLRQIARSVRQVKCR